MDRHEMSRAAAQDAANPRARAILIGLMLTTVVAMLVAVGALVYAWDVQRDARLEAEAEKDQAVVATATIADQIAEACDSGGDVADRLRKRGVCDAAKRAKRQVQNPEVVVGPPGEPGEQGEQGEAGPSPSPTQLLAAVSAYCRVTDCTEGPSLAQIQSAVSSYCVARCEGPPGKDGTDGTDGTDGAPGADAPPPTREDLLEAFSAFCEAREDQCRGPKGDKGDVGGTGPGGPAGPAGPTCPDGYIPQERTVRSDQVPTGELAVLCVRGQPAG